MIINAYVMKESQQKKRNDGNITKPPGSCNYEKRSGNYEMKAREREFMSLKGYKFCYLCIPLYACLCMCTSVYQPSGT